MRQNASLNEGVNENSEASASPVAIASKKARMSDDSAASLLLQPLRYDALDLVKFLSSVTLKCFCLSCSENSRRSKKLVSYKEMPLNA